MFPEISQPYRRPFKRRRILHTCAHTTRPAARPQDGGGCGAHCSDTSRKTGAHKQTHQTRGRIHHRPDDVRERHLFPPATSSPRDRGPPPPKCAREAPPRSRPPPQYDFPSKFRPCPFAPPLSRCTPFSQVLLVSEEQVRAASIAWVRVWFKSGHGTAQWQTVPALSTYT